MRFRIAVPAAVALLAIFLASAPAALAEESEVKWIQNLATQQCLEEFNDDVRLYGCDGTAEQLWIIVQHAGDGDEVVSLQNLASGACLEAYRGEVHAYYCDGTIEQRWEPMAQDNTDVYPLLRNLSTNSCLDRNNSVMVDDCQHGNPDQKWYWEGN